MKIARNNLLIGVLFLHFGCNKMGCLGFVFMPFLLLGPGAFWPCLVIDCVSFHFVLWLVLSKGDKFGKGEENC